MISRSLFALALAAALAAPAQAIEMFTNFNNGTELGTRPLGIETLSPVRYHSWQHAGRWYHGPGVPCDNAGYMPAPAVPGPPTPPPPVPDRAASSRRSKAVMVEPDGVPSAGLKPSKSANDDWIRSSNFLPPAESN